MSKYGRAAADVGGFLLAGILGGAALGAFVVGTLWLGQRIFGQPVGFFVAGGVLVVLWFGFLVYEKAKDDS